ncbi:hypothetical protein EIP91_006099 [Steccherinum ochraceum]|uniref:Protein kinase domain-containing protein n=1 Tax=Steccherinum ochraceum TaxID=92696 RepID=A0A4V2MVR1_9APHY|nr:hypothetical protein EIP91_006099 [Steccherinum ochraceum]
MASQSTVSSSNDYKINDLRRFMLDVLDSKHYFPQFVWKFFLSSIGPRYQTGYRVHVYDVFEDILHETRRIPQSKAVFADFHTHTAAPLADECLAAIKHAEESFARLEASAERVLTTLLHNLTPSDSGDDEEMIETEMKRDRKAESSTRPLRRTVTLDAREEHVLIKYLVFLRFRNSEAYHETVVNLGKKASKDHPWMRLIERGPLRRRAVLRSICAFLDHEIGEGGGESSAEYFADIEEHCWRPIREGRVELSVGVASEAQEYVTTEMCFGYLDEVGPDGLSDGSYHLFMPITPSVAIYLVTRAPDRRAVQMAPDVYPLELLTEIVSPSLAKRKRAEETPGSDIHSPSSRPPSPKRTKSTPLPIAMASTTTLKRKREDDINTPDPPRPTLTKRSKTDSILTSTSSTPSLPQTVSFHDGMPPHRVTIECDTEQVPDVHIRNAILLLSSPRYILFSSLSSLITAITVSTPASLLTTSPSSSTAPSSSSSFTSFNRLKSLCREKHIREGLMKTLLVRGDVPVTDLTEEVKVYGECAIEHGSFADIWKGEWVERGVMGLGKGTKRIIAMKVLRQYMIDNVKEKLLKRLKDEVLTWHRLRHPHIAPLYGIVQLPHHLAMVSPWCTNGTVVHYLKEVNPGADRALLVSLFLGFGFGSWLKGIAYLHNFKPVVIHGDLKGNNILIDDRGHALITDFGVSKVIEDFSNNSSSPSGSSLTSSFFEGATRWMAPEIILALVEDVDESGCAGTGVGGGEGEESGESGGVTRRRGPELTKMSDVYAFASVCLEIMTGQLPYPLRTNPHSVTIDKMRGVKPSSGVRRHTLGTDAFWAMMDRCWDEWYLRPDMNELTQFFRGSVKGKGPA